MHRFVRAVVLENSPREMKLTQTSTRREPASPIGRLPKRLLPRRVKS